MTQAAAQVYQPRPVSSTNKQTILARQSTNSRKRRARQQTPPESGLLQSRRREHFAEAGRRPGKQRFA